jgi:predicted dienelactone hydrolase
MRPFEFITFFILIIAAAMLLLSHKLSLAPRNRVTLLRSFALLPIIAMFAQWLIYGSRWQFLPAYALAVLVGVGLLAKSRSQTVSTNWLDRRSIKISITAILSLGLVLALVLPLIFPIPVLSAPTGKYLVGTAQFYLKDDSRTEIYTDDPNGKRELMMQIWYPAKSVAGAQPMRWLDRLDIAGPIIARRLNLPSFVLSHADQTDTQSYINAPIADDIAQFPIIVYSHGWTGFRTINLDQSQELASHGYVVIALDHSYAAMITVFPDGRVAALKPEILPPNNSPDFNARFMRLVNVFADDVQFALDQLTLTNNGQPNAQLKADWLKGRLDMGRIGLMGHSTGGAAIVRVCILDARCKAGFGQDVATNGVSDDVLTKGLQQPFFVMWSQDWRGNSHFQRFTTLLNTTKNPLFRAVVSGSKHYDFVMISLLSPLASTLGLKGPIDGRRMMSINNAYLLAYFDQFLRSASANSVTGLSQYPEVSFER